MSRRKCKVAIGGYSYWVPMDWKWGEPVEMDMDIDNWPLGSDRVYRNRERVVLRLNDDHYPEPEDPIVLLYPIVRRQTDKPQPEPKAKKNTIVRTVLSDSTHKALQEEAQKRNKSVPGIARLALRKYLSKRQRERRDG